MKLRLPSTFLAAVLPLAVTAATEDYALLEPNSITPANTVHDSSDDREVSVRQDRMTVAGSVSFFDEKLVYGTIAAKPAGASGAIVDMCESTVTADFNMMDGSELLMSDSAIMGDVTIGQGGRITTAGSLICGNLTIASGASFVVECSGWSQKYHEHLSVTGNVRFASNAAITLVADEGDWCVYTPDAPIIVTKSAPSGLSSVLMQVESLGKGEDSIAWTTRYHLQETLQSNGLYAVYVVDAGAPAPVEYPIPAVSAFTEAVSTVHDDSEDSGVSIKGREVTVSRYMEFSREKLRYDAINVEPSRHGTSIVAMYDSVVTADINVGAGGELLLSSSAVVGEVVIGKGGRLSADGSLVTGNLAFATGACLGVEASEWATEHRSPLYVNGAVVFAPGAYVNLLTDAATPEDCSSDIPVIVSKAEPDGLDAVVLRIESLGDDSYGQSHENTTLYHLQKATQSDGTYAVRIVRDGSAEPPIPDIDPAPAIGHVIVSDFFEVGKTDFYNKKWGATIVDGGALDVRKIGSGTVIPGGKITGTGGTLIMGDDQCLVASGSQQLGYSVTNGYMEFNGAGKWTLAGSGYSVKALSVAGGVLDISGETVLGSVAGDKTDLLVTGNGKVNNSGTACLASLVTEKGAVYANNNITRAAKVDISRNSAVFNTRTWEAGSMDVKGALNNSGTLSATGGIRATGTIYNSGRIRDTSVRIAGNGSLELVNGGSVSAVEVDGHGGLLGAGSAGTAVIHAGGCLGSMSSADALGINRLTMEQGATLCIHLSADTTPLSIGSLTLAGDVRLSVGVSESLLYSPALGEDETFSVVVAKADEVHGDGDFDTQDVAIGDGGEFLASPLVFEWLDNELIVHGRVNTERLLDLVEGNSAMLADTLWSSVSMMRSFVESQTCAPMSGSANGSLWVRAMGGFARMSDDGALNGFKYRGGGLALGGAAQVGEGTQIGLSLGHAWGTHRHDHGRLSVDKTAMMAGIYASHERAFSNGDTMTLNAYLVGGRVENRASVHALGNAGADAKWDDSMYGGGARIAWNLRVNDSFWVSPFTGVDYLTARQDDFSEVAAAGTRRYDGADADVWTASVGVTTRGVYKCGSGGCISPHASLAYTGDLHRSAPCVSTKVADHVVKGKGRKPGAHGVSAEIGADWMVDGGWSMGIYGQSEVRGHERACSAGVYSTWHF